MQAEQELIDAGAANVATFTFPHNTWFSSIYGKPRYRPSTILGKWCFSLYVAVLDIWKWLSIAMDASDIFAPNATPANNEMYIDDFRFADTPVPVELTSFTGIVNTLGQVVLNWETASELNNLGFEIERRTETSEFRTVGFVEGNGTTTQQNSYSYVDKTAEQGVNYYRLKQVDFNGTYEYSEIVEVEVVGPLTFELAQNYPNPFNPSTNIKYSTESGNIRLSVYNLVGEEVAVLVNGFSQAGFFEVTFDASNLSTGVYLYKLQSANSVQTKKMMLLK
ncbi:MAG: T9SS type A sorting domain-containing protein [bacterium]|nr:T9SS type A sorting domain-containing protein [bacterium]